MSDFPKDADPIHAVSLGIAAGAAGLLMTLFLNKKLKEAPRGNELMNKISDQIKSGATAFLTTEYKYLSCFVVVIFVVLVVLYTLDPPSGDKKDGIRYASSFLVGAILSAAAGWGGMAVATDANVRTTQAADKEGLDKALRVAFTGGAVMGFTVVSLGLMGVSVMFFLMTLGQEDDTDEGRYKNAADSLAGFGFGASSIALFARVAGGIYTKAADVGADLVGKVEMDIPEDDPRNPAVIADNVGDNVGDVAGMGADLFESFVGSIIAAVTLADGEFVKIALPFWVAGCGILASMIGYFAVGTKEGATQKELLFALHKGTLVSSFFVTASCAALCGTLFEDKKRRMGDFWLHCHWTFGRCHDWSSHRILYFLLLLAYQVHYRSWSHWSCYCHHPRFGYWYDLVCLPRLDHCWYHSRLQRFGQNIRNCHGCRWYAEYFGCHFGY